jgi:hypothetical protein
VYFDRAKDIQARADREAERKGLLEKLKQQDKKSPPAGPDRRPTQTTPGTTSTGRSVPR